jgi:hypothetical protein
MKRRISTFDSVRVHHLLYIKNFYASLHGLDYLCPWQSSAPHNRGKLLFSDLNHPLFADMTTSQDLHVIKRVLEFGMLSKPLEPNSNSFVFQNLNLSGKVQDLHSGHALFYVQHSEDTFFSKSEIQSCEKLYSQNTTILVPEADVVENPITYYDKRRLALKAQFTKIYVEFDVQKQAIRGEDILQGLLTLIESKEHAESNQKPRAILLQAQSNEEVMPIVLESELCGSDSGNIEVPLVESNKEKDLDYSSDQKELPQKVADADSSLVPIVQNEVHCPQLSEYKNQRGDTLMKPTDSAPNPEIKPKSDENRDIASLKSTAPVPEEDRENQNNHQESFTKDHIASFQHFALKGSLDAEPAIQQSWNSTQIIPETLALLSIRDEKDFDKTIEGEPIEPLCEMIDFIEEIYAKQPASEEFLVSGAADLHEIFEITANSLAAKGCSGEVCVEDVLQCLLTVIDPQQSASSNQKPRATQSEGSNKQIIPIVKVPLVESNKENDFDWNLDQKALPKKVADLDNFVVLVSPDEAGCKNSSVFENIPPSRRAFGTSLVQNKIGPVTSASNHDIQRSSILDKENCCRNKNKVDHIKLGRDKKKLDEHRTEVLLPDEECMPFVEEFWGEHQREETMHL